MPDASPPSRVASQPAQCAQASQPLSIFTTILCFKRRKKGKHLTATRVAGLSSRQTAGFPTRNASGSAAHRPEDPCRGGSRKRAPGLRCPPLEPDRDAIRTNRSPTDQSAPACLPHFKNRPETRLFGIRRMMRTPAGEQARKDRRDADPEQVDAARGCGGRLPGTRS